MRSELCTVPGFPVNAQWGLQEQRLLYSNIASKDYLLHSKAQCIIYYLTINFDHHMCSLSQKLHHLKQPLTCHITSHRSYVQTMIYSVIIQPDLPCDIYTTSPSDSSYMDNCKYRHKRTLVQFLRSYIVRCSSTHDGKKKNLSMKRAG